MLRFYLYINLRIRSGPPLPIPCMTENFTLYFKADDFNIESKGTLYLGHNCAAL